MFTRYFFLGLSFLAIAQPAKGDTTLLDKALRLNDLTIGKCRFEAKADKEGKRIHFKVWVDGKESAILRSGEGSGLFYSTVTHSFPLDRASWREGHWRTGLSLLTLYSTYTNGSRSSGFNKKYIEAWFTPKGDVSYVRLFSKRHGPTLLGLITPTSYSIDCHN